MFWGFFGLDSKLDLLLKGQKAMAATLRIGVLLETR
jgi:hypothetical protein